MQLPPRSREATDGAKLYIDGQRQRGGVNGQKIEHVMLDDKFDPKTRRRQRPHADQRKGAVALFLTRAHRITSRSSRCWTS